MLGVRVCGTDMIEPGPTVRRWELAARLRALREASGKNLEQVCLSRQAGAGDFTRGGFAGALSAASPVFLLRRPSGIPEEVPSPADQSKIAWCKSSFCAADECVEVAISPH